MKSLVCPCQTHLNQAPQSFIEPVVYAECCEVLHKGDEIASTAEQLMRSRYSAFVLGLIDYIINTTLPAQQKLLDKQAITIWATNTDWAGLQIVNSTSNLSKRESRHAQVEFKAYFNTSQGRGEHHELSTFVKVITKRTGCNQHNEQWYFLDPTIGKQATQKQPCICGSGNKFKRCCGRYI